MKKILWIATGGTIASGPTAQGLTPALKGEDLLYLLPELNNLAEIDCLDLFNLDSTNLTPQAWLKMAQAIKEYYDKYDGFVISHGTDTLTWTAAALKLMLEHLQKPVVLVASQKILGEENSDVPANLMAAFTTARDATPDVYLVCAGFVFPALWVTKIASENLDCFRPTNGEPVATYDLTYHKNQITELFWLAKDHKEDTEDASFQLVPLDLNKKIAHLTITPFTQPSLIDLMADHYEGFIVEGYGAGGIPSGDNDLITALAKIVATGKPVICISQCMYDGVHLNRYAVGQQALAAGIISGGKLAKEAAHILLWKCLSNNLSLQNIAHEFAKYG